MIVLKQIWRFTGLLSVGFWIVLWKHVLLKLLTMSLSMLNLDFTFSHREELLAYVMWWLLLVEPTSTQPVHKKGMKLKNKLIHLNLIYELWKTRLL
ncbi:unnamed protein product [Brassica rapa]|uniref:Uncharacterized protein n=1 Tax=Brassica campestris TaxID=3711 RepID=A0A3P6C2B2_BRACM|nr:unnamed protein product [Brassica rapa]VDD03661.1 unnamed protein product [Brassica rapa]